MGWMNLKNTGRNPEQLVDSISPVFDLLDWYLQTNMQQIDMPSTAVAVGFTGFSSYSGSAYVVPQNEAWWVESYRVQCTLVAGESVEYTVAWATDNGITKVNLPKNAVKQQLLAGAGLGLSYAHGFFLPPNANMGYFVSASAGAGPLEFLGQARIARLPL